MKKVFVLLGLVLLWSVSITNASTETIYEEGYWSVIKITDDMTDEIGYILSYANPTKNFHFSYHDRYKGWVFNNHCILNSGKIVFRFDKKQCVYTEGRLKKHRFIFVDDEIMTGDKRYHVVLSDEMKAGNYMLVEVNLYSTRSDCKSVNKIKLEGFTAAYNFMKRQD